jgi:hypothetical protein
MAWRHAWRCQLCCHARLAYRRHGRGVDVSRDGDIHPVHRPRGYAKRCGGRLWIVAGRRSGKTIAIATIAAYLAGCCDHRDCLGPGERGVLRIMAANTLQAGQCYNFIRGIFTNIPRFAALVEQLGGRHGGITTDTISLKNRIDIQVRPASFRTIRGITAIGVIAEECSMWQSDDSRNPDREILAAARPCLATTGGALFAIGSPHARKGETYNTYNKHFGANGNPAILVANGPTKLFNPTIKQSVIDRAYEDDPQVAASEWGGRFREDLESYVSPEIVDACTVRGVYRLDFVRGVSYIAHADPSGGSQDYVAGIFDPAGAGSSMPPGGWPAGSPEADPFAHLSWSPKPQ